MKKRWKMDKKKCAAHSTKKEMYEAPRIKKVNIASSHRMATCPENAPTATSASPTS